MKNKTNAYLRDENLLTLFSLNNLIVPEIQREYVWGSNTVVLENFLNDLKNNVTPCVICHQVHTTKNINLGFLYSYKPQYVKYESERILDEYIIDGQQRITTLFLLLLYRATIENRMDDFINIFRVNELLFEIGFNYKVRNLTQQFIFQLIEHARNKGEHAFDFVNDDRLNNRPYWFLNDYLCDPTVLSMVKAIKSMAKIFGDRKTCYFDFLLINIHFWHFKTEVTSQGEELYITMNSRGEQLVDNEMKKARVLPSAQLVEYGAKWEEWQTVFWRNRGINNNSDKGFNNYLCAIEGLEYFLGNTQEKQSPKIETIEKYINGLRYITGCKFREWVLNKYKDLYIGWFEPCIEEIWTQINTYEGSWDIVDPRGKDDEFQKDYRNKSSIRNKSMLFWPWMYYFNKLADGEPDDEYLLRLLRFYYVRYHCYKRSTTTIKTIVDITSKTDFILKQEYNDVDSEEEDNMNAKIFSEEELLLSRMTCSNMESRKTIESLIWEIQDLEYFIDGRDVGGNTILNFIRAETGIIDETNICDSLLALKNNIKTILIDGSKNTGNIIVKEILLFYKHDNNAYWVRQSPHYYNNYETSSWKRIVRTPHFLAFYKEYVNMLRNNRCSDLNDFLFYKRKEFFSIEENKNINRSNTPCSHRRLCILYDFLTRNNLWDCDHANISFWSYKEDNDAECGIFSEQDTLWKAKRYYDNDKRVNLPDNWEKLLYESFEVNVEGSINKAE